jgi:hypothetical protein
VLGILELGFTKFDGLETRKQGVVFVSVNLKVILTNV